MSIRYVEELARSRKEEKAEASRLALAQRLAHTPGLGNDLGPGGASLMGDASTMGLGAGALSAAHAARLSGSSLTGLPVQAAHARGSALSSALDYGKGGVGLGGGAGGGEDEVGAAFGVLCGGLERAADVDFLAALRK